MSGSILGTRVLRTEDPRLITSGGNYLDDVPVDGAHFVTYARATVAHARIVGLDVSAARNTPGVVAVFTAADVAGLPPLPPDPMANQQMLQPWLAADRVRYVGEPIAAIIHTGRYVGEDALEGIDVDYDPLPVVVDPEASINDDLVLFPTAGTNTAFEVSVEPENDPFENCEVRVRHRSSVPRVAPCPLEVRGAIAHWEGERLTFHVSSQTPHRVRDDLVTMFHVPEDDIRVVVTDVGGGFGAKIGDYPDELFIAWLARETGLTLKWTESRSESMVAMGHGRAQLQELEIGGSRDGRIEAYRLTSIQDCGAYPRVGATLPYWTRTVVPGPYDIRAVGYSCTSVVTNTTPVVAYRGAGRPEATAAIERAIDLFSAEIGMDPAEVRRINLVSRDDFPYVNAMGVVYDSGDYARALDVALAESHYEELRREQAELRAARATHQLGIGLCTYVEITNGTVESEYARTQVLEGGRLSIHTGTSPQGQGHDTTWAMLASEQTGIPLDRIEVVHGDTASVARGVGTYGSRSLQAGGVAVRNAAVELVEVARGVAAQLMEANADDVVMDTTRGVFHVVGVPTSVVDWDAVLHHQQSHGLELDIQVDVKAQGATFPFGAHVVVVEVDMETGQVRIRRVVAVDDAGTIINPVIAEGQIHGGLAQGLANGLLEEMQYDTDGNPMTSNLAFYPFISACELPHFDTFRTETPTPLNDLGAKGIGEAGTIGAAPALQNAVTDALSHLGIRHVDTPTTCGRVWKAIKAASPLQEAAS